MPSLGHGLNEITLSSVIVKSIAPAVNEIKPTKHKFTSSVNKLVVVAASTGGPQTLEYFLKELHVYQHDLLYLQYLFLPSYQQF